MRRHLPHLLTDLLALHVLLTGANYNLVPMLESFFEGTPNLRWLSISRKDTQSHSTASEEVSLHRLSLANTIFCLSFS